MPTSHWSYPAIKDLASKNIISGYGNGIFGFGDVATREQVAALIYRVLVPNKQGGSFSNDGTRYVLKDGSTFKNPYGDINQKFYNVPRRGINFNEFRSFKGDENGQFRPKASVSRAEMAQILTNAFHLAAKQKHTFKDVPNPFWAETQLVQCSQMESQMAQGTGILNRMAQ